MDKKPNEIHVDLCPTKINNHTEQYFNSYTTINTPYS